MTTYYHSSNSKELMAYHPLVKYNEDAHLAPPGVFTVSKAKAKAVVSGTTGKGRWRVGIPPTSSAPTQSSGSIPSAKANASTLPQPPHPKRGDKRPVSGDSARDTQSKSRPIRVSGPNATKAIIRVRDAIHVLHVNARMVLGKYEFI